MYRSAAAGRCRQVRVRTYTTVGTVCAAALLGGLVDLDVLDDESAGVEALGVGVGLGVLQELQEELGGLYGPSGAGHTPGLACWSSGQLHAFFQVSVFPPMISHVLHLHVQSLQASNRSKLLPMSHILHCFSQIQKTVMTAAAGNFALVESGRIVPWAVRPMEPQ